MKIEAEIAYSFPKVDGDIAKAKKFFTKEFNHEIKALKIPKGAITWEITEWADRDSNNPSHGSDYFNIILEGKEEDLKKIAGFSNNNP